MTLQASAFWVAAPGRGEIRAETLSRPAAGEVVVRTMFSGISRGTEALVFGGHVPASEAQRMRAPFQAGEFPAPVKYGYASVGRVEHGPADLEGRVVFVLHPHQTRYVVPASAVHVIPDHVPPARAVLAANLETALNGVWDARPNLGDRIAVIGAGAVGCLAAWLLGQIPGCDVELVDVNPRRASVAAALGVRYSPPGAAAADADLVVHASGTAAGLELALRLAGLEATIAELSWFGEGTVPLSLGQAFHAKRLTIRSSQVGRVSPLQHPRWDTLRRMRLALNLLGDPALDALVTGESDFDRLPDTMAALAAGPGNVLCQRVRYPATDEVA